MCPQSLPARYLTSIRSRGSRVGSRHDLAPICPAAQVSGAWISRRDYVLRRAMAYRGSQIVNVVPPETVDVTESALASSKVLVAGLEHFRDDVDAAAERLKRALGT